MDMSYIFKLNESGNKEIGFLVPMESGLNIPFEVKRIFYTYGVPYNKKRGAHSYHETEQVLICICGKLKVRCYDGRQEKIYELTSPSEGLYIKSKIWRETFEHSEGAVLLILSSQQYDENDYIRDFCEFIKIAVTS